MSSKRLLVSLIISSPTTTASLTSILNPINKQTTSNYFARRANTGITIQWKTCRARVSGLHPGYVSTLPQKSDHNTSKNTTILQFLSTKPFTSSLYLIRREDVTYRIEIDQELRKNERECSSLEAGCNGVNDVPQKLIRRLTVV
jgi:hypothetical protein